MNAAVPSPTEPSFAERRAALALLEAILPHHPDVPGADERTLEASEAIIRHLSPSLVGVWWKALRTLSAAAVLRTGSPFHALDADAQDALLQVWAQDPVLRAPLSLTTLLFKLVHFDREDVYEALGGRRNVVHGVEEPRWLSQIVRGVDHPPEEVVECAVVVVGTGAGGAVVGAELAARGYAVAFVEEGEHHRRDSFTGSVMRAHLEFYRGGMAVGAALMPIFMGRMVGGSTAINGGTCFRTPSWVLDRWCEDLASDAFSPGAMAKWFDRVETRMQVAPTPDRLAGPFAHRIHEVSARLGWRSAPIRRNAPGCDGKGFCDFGCRTDARQSTNVSFVPDALEHGAMAFTGLRVDRVLVDQGRATGVEAVGRDGRRIKFKANAVILAGGALPTALLLQRQGLANRSGQVGRNLSLHPSGAISGLFDERLATADYVPQGFFLDHFLRDEGFLLLGAGADRNNLAPVIPATGHALMDAMARRDHIGSIATLVADSVADGVVRLEAEGQIGVTWHPRRADIQRLHQAMVRGGELLLAAGATKLYPLRTSTPVLAPADFQRFAQTLPPAGDLPLLSYHPLGSCRMGRDPRTSVVDLDHQTHDVRRLFVVDGSVVGGPLGVNPQVTIMALAARAAERIADVLG